MSRFEQLVELILEMSAYHGSRSEISNFSTPIQKTANAEVGKEIRQDSTGQNLFGWGIYFSAGTATAKEYAGYEGNKNKFDTKTAEKSGNLIYNVELKAEEDELINWYGSYEQQSEKVKKGFEIVAGLNDCFKQKLEKIKQATKPGWVAYKSLAICLQSAKNQTSNVVNSKNDSEQAIKLQKGLATKEGERQASFMLYTKGGIKGTLARSNSENFPKYFQQDKTWYCIFSGDLVTVNKKNGRFLQPNKQPIMARVTNTFNRIFNPEKSL